MRQKIGKRKIIRYDAAVDAEYKELNKRRSELISQRNRYTGEIKQAQLNMGMMVSEGCDYDEYIPQLSELRSQVEAMSAGIEFIDNQLTRLKRANHWL